VRIDDGLHLNAVMTLPLQHRVQLVMVRKRSLTLYALRFFLTYYKAL
jgi:hypothetical protein